MVLAAISRRGWLAGVAGRLVAQQAPEPPLAPEFQLTDSKGKKRSLSEFRGKLVLLNFWATWCPPCRAELPMLNRAHLDFGPRGFTVLGVATDQRGWAVVTPFLAQYEIVYPVLLGNPKVARAYGGLETVPQTFLIDPAGRQLAAYRGKLREEPLRQLLEKVLAALQEPQQA